MVLNKDPRAILELLNKPVDRDEDEFLDRLDENKTFQHMPDHPQSSSINTDAVVTNDAQQQMLGTMNQDHAPIATTSAPPSESSSLGRRFFALFQKAEDKSEAQTSLPNYMDYSQVSEPTKVAMPRVTDTEEEKQAKLEDQERRDAYIMEELKKKENEKNGGEMTKEQIEAHKRYVALFGELPKKT